MHLILEINVSKEIKKMIAIMLFALICAHPLTHSSWHSTRLPTPDLVDNVANFV